MKKQLFLFLTLLVSLFACKTDAYEVSSSTYKVVGEIESVYDLRSGGKGHIEGTGEYDANERVSVRVVPEQGYKVEGIYFRYSGSTYDQTNFPREKSRMLALSSHSFLVKGDITVIAVISSSLQISERIEVRVGETVRTPISGGKSPYIATPADDKISVKVEGSEVVVTGERVGESSVRVTDANGISKTIIVVVRPGSFDIEVPSEGVILYTKSPDNTKQLTISGGSGNFSAVAGNGHLRAEIVSGKLSLTGLTRGISLVTVRDQEHSTERQLSVKVYEHLVLDKETVVVKQGASAIVNIVEGERSYEISSNPDATYAIANLVGTTVTIEGKRVGTTTFVIKDQVTQEVKTVTVRVEDNDDDVDIIVE